MNALKPPIGPEFVQTPVREAVFPVNVDARLGQQSGSGTNAFVYVMPFGTSVRATCGMYRGVIVSHRWSAERIRTTLGRSVVAAGPAAAEAESRRGPAVDRPAIRMTDATSAAEMLRRRAVFDRSESLTARSVSVPIPRELPAEELFRRADP